MYPGSLELQYKGHQRISDKRRGFGSQFARASEKRHTRPFQISVLVVSLSLCLHLAPSLPSAVARSPARPWPPSERGHASYGGYWPWSAYKPSSTDTRAPRGRICMICMNVYKELGPPTRSLACPACALTVSGAEGVFSSGTES
jgi:hypothetical protein